MCLFHTVQFDKAYYLNIWVQFYAFFFIKRGFIKLVCLKTISKFQVKNYFGNFAMASLATALSQ